VNRRELVYELQDRGIKYRQAWAAVDAVFEAMKLGLRRDGNVELPFGRLVLTRNRPAFNMLRQGKLVPMNRMKWKIKLVDTERADMGS
jgi:nucleoid DNA-binding protein